MTDALDSRFSLMFQEVKSLERIDEEITLVNN